MKIYKFKVRHHLAPHGNDFLIGQTNKNNTQFQIRRYDKICCDPTGNILMLWKTEDCHDAECIYDDTEGKISTEDILSTGLWTATSSEYQSMKIFRYKDLTQKFPASTEIEMKIIDGSDIEIIKETPNDYNVNCLFKGKVQNLFEFNMLMKLLEL